MYMIECSHATQLDQAHHMLMDRLGPNGRYRIQLWHDPRVTDYDAPPTSDRCNVIEVKLDDRNRLMAADEYSERMIEAWEKKKCRSRE